MAASVPLPPPFVLDAVNLPPGLAVNPATGLIQGRPTVVGTYLAGLVATNAVGSSPVWTLQIVVAPAAQAPVITSPATAAARTGTVCNYRIVATNNPTAYEVAGAPAWMSVDNRSGILAGIPPAPGIVTLQLFASNAAGASAPVTLTLTIEAAPNAPVITSSQTAFGRVGSPFSYTITATNNPTALLATGLPAGLAFDGLTGTISGTPTASGRFEAVLTVTNASGNASVTLVFVIQPNTHLVLPGS
jgi:hypothetical protein